MFFMHQDKDQAMSQAVIGTNRLHKSHIVVGPQAYRQIHIHRKKTVEGRLRTRSLITSFCLCRIKEKKHLQSTKVSYIRDYISIYIGILEHLMSATCTETQSLGCLVSFILQLSSTRYLHINTMVSKLKLDLQPLLPILSHLPFISHIFLSFYDVAPLDFENRTRIISTKIQENGYASLLPQVWLCLVSIHF